MSAGMDRDRVAMIVACLQQDSTDAITEWAQLNVHTVEDILNFAISLTSIASAWMVAQIPIPEGATYAVPPGLTCRADADAHRAVVLMANKDYSAASAHLQGVVNRGAIADVTTHLAAFAHAAISGTAEEIPL